MLTCPLATGSEMLLFLNQSSSGKAGIRIINQGFKAPFTGTIADQSVAAFVDIGKVTGATQGLFGIGKNATMWSTV